MKNLNLLEQEALGILKQLEFDLARFGSSGGKKENGSSKGVEILVNDIEITPFLKRPGKLGIVAQFLQDKRLNFSTLVDGINNPLFLQDETIVSDTILGMIKGENIQSINIKIKELINELTLKPETQMENQDNSKYIFKDINGDYYLNDGHKPRLLKLGKRTKYYVAFDALYSLVPEGGIVSFSDFSGVVSSIVKRKLMNKNDKEKCRIIRSYLTDRKNGFLRASKIGEATFNNKPMIECEPKTGITFNNRK